MSFFYYCYSYYFNFIFSSKILNNKSKIKAYIAPTVVIDKIKQSFKYGETLSK